MFVLKNGLGKAVLFNLVILNSSQSTPIPLPHPEGRRMLKKGEWADKDGPALF